MSGSHPKYVIATGRRRPRNPTLTIRRRHKALIILVGKITGWLTKVSLHRPLPVRAWTTIIGVGIGLDLVRPGV